MKRCGKSAPRVRQRNRHGKPHREQDRIGMATRVVRESENARGSDVRLAVRVGCSRQRASAVPEEWPSRLGRGNAGKALQNPAYRPADTDQRGVRRERAGPLAISRAWREVRFRRYACLASAISPLYCLGNRPNIGIGQGERLEPRIVLHPGCHSTRRHRGRRCRMRRGKQRDLRASIQPRVEPGRAAVQDHVRHHQRGHDHRPLHRIFRLAPAAACSHDSRRDGPTGSAGGCATGRAGPPECSRAGPIGPDHRGWPHAAATGAPARTGSVGAGRTTTRATRAAAGSGRSDRLRHSLRRAYHRSLHRDLRTPAEQRPITT